ncbi:MAG: FliM/FliN family flagellar motor switch protein [Myxococcota bacterium]
MPRFLEPLPSWSREDVDRARRLARAARAEVLPALSAALETQLGGAVALTPGTLEPWGAGTLAAGLPEPLVALVVAPPEGPASAFAALEVDARLAEALVDRVLGGEGELPGAALGPLGDVERGVLLWLGAQLLEAAAPGWRAHGVLTSREALVGVLGDGGLAGWPATLTLPGGASGPLRLLAPDALPLPAAPARAALGAYADAPVRATVDGGVATVTVAELRGLGRGDVVVLDDAPFAEGRATLRVAGLHWALTRDAGGFRVGARTRAPVEGEGLEMRTRHEESDTEIGLRELDEAPITLAVELARVTLRLAEARALRPGELLPTGSAVGTRVRLRAGDVAVAEGELVDVDGELGVRIVRLAADPLNR